MGAIVAVTRPRDGILYYAKGDGPGNDDELDLDAVARLRTGPCTVVLRDYALLSDATVRGLVAPHGVVGLLPPANRRSETAAELALAATANPGTVALLTPEKQREIARHLHEVGKTSRQLDDLEARLLDLAERASPEYAALLQDDRRLRIGASTILRRYPSPRTLLGVNPLTLGSLLGSGDRLADLLLVEQVARIGSTASTMTDSQSVRLAEHLIPGLADLRDSAARYLSTLETGIYRIANPSAMLELQPALPPAHGEKLPLTLAGGSRGDPDPTPVSTKALVRRCHEALQRRYEEPCRSDVGWADYRSARAALDRARDELDPLVLAELEVAGQILAMDSGDLIAETGYAAAAIRALEALPEDRASLPDTRRVAADRDLVHAMTEAIGTVPAAHVQTLRSAIAIAESATPALLLEARGLLALVLGFYGEATEARALLVGIEAAGDDLPGFHGAARAPADVARLLTTGSAYEDEALASARERSARSSTGTSMVLNHHYVVMLTSIVAKDPDAGIAAYESLRRESALRPISPRARRMAPFVYSVLLAAIGNLPGARAALGAAVAAPWFEPDPTASFLHTFVLTRLRLAAGRYDQALAATAPGSPLAEDSVLLSQARRWAPACLAARAAALSARGSDAASAALFRRAFAMAAAHGEYIVLLIYETPEMRTWLAGLDPTDLPPGVTPDVVEGILRSPFYTEPPVARLTKQERKVLNLLAAGRSMASMVSELSVSSNTLKTHLRQIYRKLGVTTREDAVIVADEHGLLL